jgi:Holliday junction resolvasome RuvABC DNA-binding subunit
MTIPVIEIQGIGPKTAEFLRNNGIITVKDLLKNGTRYLQQAPGFGQKRAEQVLEIIASSPDTDSKSSGVKTGDKKDKKKNKKKDKKKSGKDKKKRNKKKDKKKKKK